MGWILSLITAVFKAIFPPKPVVVSEAERAGADEAKLKDIEVVQQVEAKGTAARDAVGSESAKRVLDDERSDPNNRDNQG